MKDVTPNHASEMRVSNAFIILYASDFAKSSSSPMLPVKSKEKITSAFGMTPGRNTDLVSDTDSPGSRVASKVSGVSEATTNCMGTAMSIINTINEYTIRRFNILFHLLYERILYLFFFY